MKDESKNENNIEGPFGRDGKPFPQNDNPKVTTGGEIVY